MRFLCLLICLTACTSERMNSSLSSTEKELVKELFETGKAYVLPITHHGVFGFGNVVFTGEKLQVNVTIDFYGAGSFARATTSDVKKALNLEVAKEYFGRVYYSFDDSPAAPNPNVKDDILQTIPHLENMLSTEILTVKIHPRFPVDFNVFGQKSEAEEFTRIQGIDKYMEELRLAVQERYVAERRLASIPVIVGAVSKAGGVFEWNPYELKTELGRYAVARGLARFLGISIEGHQYFRYPADGLMNGTYEIAEFRKRYPKKPIQLTRSDVNEFMQYFVENNAALNWKVSKARKVFTPVHNDWSEKPLFGEKYPRVEGSVEVQINEYHRRAKIKVDAF